MTESLHLKKASTLVLTKKNAEGFKIILIKRKNSSRFMPGAHVFPGGALDEEDKNWANKADIAAQEWANQRLICKQKKDSALAYFAAAIRETAEECGIWLVRTQDSEWPNREKVKKLNESLKNGSSFYSLVARERFRPHFQSLTALSWWQTPKTEPKRYDTRFFLCQAPPVQGLEIDLKESDAGDWFCPKKALLLHKQGQIYLAPPTFLTVDTLASAQFCLTKPEISFNKPNTSICPTVQRTNSNEPVLLLPSDPLFGQGNIELPYQKTRFCIDKQGRFY